MDAFGLFIILGLVLVAVWGGEIVHKALRPPRQNGRNGRPTDL
jgi:hypothetical protein